MNFCNTRATGCLTIELRLLIHLFDHLFHSTCLMTFPFVLYTAKCAEGSK
jgi:hypothetical protein